jgi:hypothetical protein
MRVKFPIVGVVLAGALLACVSGCGSNDSSSNDQFIKTKKPGVPIKGLGGTRAAAGTTQKTTLSPGSITQ